MVTGGSLHTSTRRSHRESGFTLAELAIALFVVSVFMTGVSFAVFATQRSFSEDQLLSSMLLRGQNALLKLTTTARKGVTKDEGFKLDCPVGDDTYSLLTFREFMKFDMGTIWYYQDRSYFLYGDADGAYPCRGVIIGRGATLADIFNTGKGADGFLGSLDDDVDTALWGEVPAVELLIPDTFKPKTGKMLVIRPDPVNSLLLTFTVRLNAIGANGDYILAEDLVLSQKVALRQ